MLDRLVQVFESWIQRALHRADPNSSAVRPSGRMSPDAPSPCSTRSRAQTTSAAGKWSGGRSSARSSSTNAEVGATAPRRPATCATFDAELEAQSVAIVANMKPGRRQLIGGQTLGAPTVQASRGETGGGLVCIPWLHLCVVRLTGERNLGVPFCRPQSPEEEDFGV